MDVAAPSCVPAEGEILESAARGDLDRLRRLLSACEAPLSLGVARAVAESFMKRRQWADAAKVLDALGERDAAGEVHRCLARNMAAMQEHRPEVYRVLVTTPASDRYRLVTCKTGHLSVAFRDQTGRLVSLSPGDDPLGALAQAIARLGRAGLADGPAISLCGMGDGYLLRHLAQNPPKLYMDAQQPVYVLEPQPLAAIACLMLHDYTGPQGPIEQQRFQWSVGPLWANHLERRSREDQYLPPPALNISQSPEGEAIAARVRQVTQGLMERQSLHKQQADAYYAALSRDELAAVFGPNPPRQPRILLITTRFSTVLQYSTRDAAEAFEKLGCRVHVLIEPSPYHRLLKPSFARVLAEFRPDLVFQIDHLRHEHGGLFHPKLPFVCWVQDHLSNLTSSEAGRQIGTRDFVLGAMSGMYVQRYGYPDRQCLCTYKLTRLPPQRPATWTSDGDDLAYVSNASQTPECLVDRTLALFAEAPRVQPLVHACCQRILKRYEQEETVSTHYEIRLLLGEVEQEAGLTITDSILRQQVVDALFDYLNNALYRQQGLRWAAAVADRLGLRLAIYGRGWESHPRFARFARGTITYGPDLEELTRRTKINLKLEPFFCISHQRLLDGLVAGGFFLNRAHPSDTLNQELANFLALHLDPSARSVEAARALVDPRHRAVLEQLLERGRYLAEFGDPIELVRGIQQAGILPVQDTALPFLQEVSFSDQRSLQGRIERFVADPTLRSSIAGAQRASVESRASYEAGMSRLLRQVGQLIATEGTCEQQSQGESPAKAHQKELSA